MKRSLGTWAAAAALAIAGLAGLTGCGGSSTSSNSKNTVTSQTIAHVKHRVFVTNQLASFGTAAGEINIVDADKDILAAGSPQLTTLGTYTAAPLTISLGGVPSFMVLSPDKKTTYVFDTSSTNLQFIDNTTETLSSQLLLNDVATSIVLKSDNKTGFAALRNTGNIAVLDLTTPQIATNVAVPTVRTLILSHNGNKLLAFSDDSNDINVIDTTSVSNTTTGVTATKISSATFDHPVYGLFSSDDSKAYILSCGAECGGTTARVSVLDMTSGTVTASTAVSAASVGLLDSSGNLYVAGTQGKAGKLDVVSTGNLTVTKSGVAISDGYHTLMAMGSNNQLFIGARTCNNVTSGCLSIYNTGSGTAVVDGPKGDVTGLQPLTGRNIVYATEGGELRIYDTTKGAEVPSVTTGGLLDIVGKAVDVKAIDQ